MKTTNKEESGIDMLSKIYDIRQEELQVENKNDRVILKNELNGVELEIPL